MSHKATKQDEKEFKEYTITAKNQTGPEESSPMVGKVNSKALEKDLKENDVSFSQFANSDETFRKRALKFGTPESKYEEMKLKHKWLYDQPIKADV